MATAGLELVSVWPPNLGTSTLSTRPPSSLWEETDQKPGGQQALGEGGGSYILCACGYSISSIPFNLVQWRMRKWGPERQWGLTKARWEIGSRAGIPAWRQSLYLFQWSTKQALKNSMLWLQAEELPLPASPIPMRCANSMSSRSSHGLPEYESVLCLCYQCDLKQVTWPLWASLFLAVKWEIIA